MKTTKIMALVLAVLMASTVAVTVGMTASAQTAYELGDVDMDGVITGHDSAMVTRALNVDPEMLTDEQRVLADINEDGVVDQTDADLIHACEVYAIGDVDGNGVTNACDAAVGLIVYAKEQVDRLAVIDEDVALPSYAELCAQPACTMKLSAVQYNLLDANGDGQLSAVDATAILCFYARNQVSGFEYEDGRVYLDGRYDISVSLYDGMTSNEDYYENMVTEAVESGYIFVDIPV